MKKTIRNTVYEVKLTGIYPGSDGAEKFTHTRSLAVLASDAEDAIRRAKAHADADDRSDKTLKRRISLAVDSVVDKIYLDIV